MWGNKKGKERAQERRRTDLVLNHPPAQHLPGAVVCPPDPSDEHDVDIVVSLLVKGAIHKLKLLGTGIPLDLGAGGAGPDRLLKSWR